MRIEILRACVAGGVNRAVGDVIEVSRSEGWVLCGSARKARPVPAAAPATPSSAEEAAPRRRVSHADRG